MQSVEDKNPIWFEKAFDGFLQILKSEQMWTINLFWQKRSCHAETFVLLISLFFDRDLWIVRLLCSFCFGFCAYPCIGKSTSLSLQKCCIMYSYHENATCSSFCIPGDDNNAHFLHLLRQITAGYPKSNCREECGVRPANDGSYCLMGNSILPVSWILPGGPVACCMEYPTSALSHRGEKIELLIISGGRASECLKGSYVLKEPQESFTSTSFCCHE